jgi:hypothetical protein
MRSCTVRHQTGPSPGRTERILRLSRPGRALSQSYSSGGPQPPDHMRVTVDVLGSAVMVAGEAADPLFQGSPEPPASHHHLPAGMGEGSHGSADGRQMPLPIRAQALRLATRTPVDMA